MRSARPTRTSRHPLGDRRIWLDAASTPVAHARRTRARTPLRTAHLPGSGHATPRAEAISTVEDVIAPTGAVRGFRLPLRSPRRPLVRLSVVAAAVAPGRPAIAVELSETEKSWNQPVEPYQIMGPLYYVGASDLAVFLITTNEGHILVNSGFA